MLTHLRSYGPGITSHRMFQTGPTSRVYYRGGGDAS